MNFKNKRFAPFTDEWRKPRNGKWNGYGVYDNKKNSIHPEFSDLPSFEEAIKKAIELNKNVKDGN